MEHRDRGLLHGVPGAELRLLHGDRRAARHGAGGIERHEPGTLDLGGRLGDLRLLAGVLAADLGDDAGRLADVRSPVGGVRGSDQVGNQRETGEALGNTRLPDEAAAARKPVLRWKPK